MRLNPAETSASSLSSTRQGRSEWPDAVAYREAIQSPGLSLGDPLLTGAKVAENRQGLPIAYTGRFAVVFRLRGHDGADWALRCFTTPQDGYGITRGTRYRLLATKIAALDDVFVPFRFVESGIRIAGKWYPTIAMQWAQGTPLGRWVEENREKPERLRRLAEELGALLQRLEAAGMAHGDWQHDNLLISPDGTQVTLVDYDGMFVPGLEGYPSPELGHPNYQHPERQVQHFGVGLDRFACLVMQTALLALARNPALWVQFGDGESLLFKASDLRDPAGSPVFAALRAQAELDRDEALADSLARLQDALAHGPDSTLLPVISTQEPQPLPAELVGPPEPSAQERLEKADNLDWIRTYSEVVTHDKWWQAGTSFRPGGQRQAQKDVFRYLILLNEQSHQTKEATNLMWTRVAIASVLLLVLALAQTALGPWFPLVFLMWVASAGYLGYSNWPQRKILDELEAEIAKMNQLAAERRDRVATRNRGASPQALQAAQGAQADYVAEKLRQVPINRVITIHGMPVNTKRELASAGITNALELSRRTTLPGIPQHQITTLQTWCREMEKEFEDEWRKYNASAKNVSADVQRLEMEVAEFTREANRLEREREQFPETNLRAYLKKLLPFLKL
ncbi:phosphotransferase [Armatimonas rosea]|uniref:Uncharacterized protein YukE n=1 Tax=Armatimonas rosea TaxID=685828 RepID=A0A7W9W8K0_ARMRO|nr:phosphotransferase [Armatimonas rosea]MBB6052230.1 uncharacterized protein YukE [Armatimonas rosea]